jgi:prephenate dehydratase
VTDAAASAPAPTSPLPRPLGPLPTAAPTSVGFFGPVGTFTEQAMLSQPDLRGLRRVALPTIPDVLAAAAAGTVDLGFVPIENAIEGSVTVTLDLLSFEHRLLVEREVVIPITLNLLANPGVQLDDIKVVVSFPHAYAQCRAFLAANLPGVQVLASNSTAEAARSLAETPDGHTAAIAPRRSAEVYGLATLATDIEDHPDNATRFVVVTRGGIPAATGHDKTSIVVFQRADAPGSLLTILQEFAARSINLVKLESRPTKRGLGDYCFLIDLEGHIEDELVADCLRDLKSKQADVKFLGSFPAAGEHGPDRRRQADARWAAAADWVTGLRGQIVPPAAG